MLRKIPFRDDEDRNELLLIIISVTPKKDIHKKFTVSKEKKAHKQNK